ncbi:MAG: hypothetical protein V8T90_05065 [Victivallales bacterium]
MINYYCPKCNQTFRHEESEAVICPQCQITLAIKSETPEETRVHGPSFNRRWDLLICGILIATGVGYAAWKLLNLTQDIYPSLLVIGILLAGVPKFFRSLLTDAGKQHWKKQKGSRKTEPENPTVPPYKKDVWPILKIIIWCVVMIHLLAFFGIYIFQGCQPLSPAGFILYGPLWCGVSYPPVRFFTKEYSGRIGILTFLMWLFSLGAFVSIPALILSKTVLLNDLLVWSTVFCLLPRAFIAYKLGSTEHFVRKLSMPIELPRE